MDEEKVQAVIELYDKFLEIFPRSTPSSAFFQGIEQEFHKWEEFKFLREHLPVCPLADMLIIFMAKSAKDAKQLVETMCLCQDNRGAIKEIKIRMGNRRFEPKVIEEEIFLLPGESISWVKKTFLNL